MAYTMREVAKRAGVSPATVSRVLNKTHYISVETSQRVLDVVNQLHYHKNIHARRLSTGQSNLFGLVISEITNPYFPELIRDFRLQLGTGDLMCFFATPSTTRNGPSWSLQSSVRMTCEGLPS